MANLINATLIDLLLAAAESLRNETCRVLETYREDRDREKRISERYKDEAEYFQGQQTKLAAIAREGIAKAERLFSAKVQEYANQMQSQLRRHLADPVNSQFRETLSMINEFGIQPEKSQLEQLISLNGGNPIGLAALAKTLEKVGSPFSLTYHTTADFEKDISEIRELIQNLKYIPSQYHSEGCEIYRGITADYTYPDGRILHGGRQFDSVGLLSSSHIFEREMEKLKGLKDVWAADCSYHEADQAAEAQQAEQRIANQHLETSGLPAEEIIDPETATRIAENQTAGMRIARELAAEKNRGAAVYQRVMESVK